MTKKFSYLILPVLATLFVVAPLKPALAASSIGSDVNSINNKVDQLTTIRDNDFLSADEKVAQEFQAQQDILNGVIDVSNKEISNIQDKLNKLPDFDKDSAERKLQSGYLGELEGYQTYFDAEKDKVANATSVDGLKTIANDLKAYRAGGYNDEIKNMVTFTLLYYNEDVISTAKTRIDKINADITKLQSSGFLKKGFSQNSINKASGLIADAIKLQNQAKALILQPPTQADNTVKNSTDTITNTTTDNTATDKAITPPPAPRDLIEKSIGEVKSAYNIFLQIGKDIRKALGLK